MSTSPHLKIIRKSFSKSSGLKPPSPNSRIPLSANKLKDNYFQFFEEIPPSSTREIEIIDSEEKHRGERMLGSNEEISKEIILNFLHCQKKLIKKVCFVL